MQSESQYPSYCGKFADAKPIGFPFDRLPPASKENNLLEFLTPNMAAVDVSINHISEFVNPFDATYPEVKSAQIESDASLIDEGAEKHSESQPNLTIIDGKKYFFSYSDILNQTVSMIPFLRNAK